MNEIKTETTIPTTAAEAAGEQMPAESGTPTKRKRGRKPKAVQSEQPTPSGDAASVKQSEKQTVEKSVLAALMKRNMVDGFNPYDGVVAFPQEDGSTKYQMPANVAMQWFLTRYPAGRAVVTPNPQFSTNTYAVFDCQLMDGDTPIGFPGTGSCAYNAQDELHRNFVQSAQTKAIACALRNNGFCAPYDSTDGPLKKNPEDTSNEKDDVSAPPTDLDKGSATSETQPSAREKNGPPIMVEDEDAAPASEHPNGGPAMDIERALAFIVPFGPDKGKTMKDVVETKGCGTIRYFTGSKYIGQPVYLAAKAVCTFYNG